jgi:hypothetical protein
MTLEELDFTENTDIIVPISNVKGTDIKRKFYVTSVPTGLDTKTIKIQGYVKHFTEQKINVLDINNTIDVPFAAIKDYYYELEANDNVKVNADGSFNPNGTIGEYTWIRLVLKNGVMTTDEIIVNAILRQDSLGLIKPR